MPALTLRGHLGIRQEICFLWDFHRWSHSACLALAGPLCTPHKWPIECDDDLSMTTPTGMQIILIGGGGAMMLYIMLSAIGRCAMATASHQITQRRAQAARRAADDAAAEAAGRAAALEPLALNADGTIEEPIIAIVEKTYQ